MVVTDRLIFLQLEKTGSSHVSRLLRRLFDGRYPGEKHDSIQRRSELGGRRVVGSIRSPWDWYVSMWGFGCDGRGELFDRALYPRSLIRPLTDYRLARVGRDARLLNLEALLREPGRPVRRWRELYSDSSDPELFRAWLAEVLEPRRRYDLLRDYGFSPISRFAGLMTYLYLDRFIPGEVRRRRLYGLRAVRSHRALVELDAEHNLVDHFIRAEQLERDLISVLRACGHQVAPVLAEEIGAVPRSNVSSRAREVGRYFDHATVELVRQRERLIIDKHGYAPPAL